MQAMTPCINGCPEGACTEEISDQIAKYCAELTSPRTRLRSWDHCYAYFKSQGQKGVCRDPDQAALQLGFYLASWGMYRASGFLLQYDYKIHTAAVLRLAEPKFKALWAREFGAGDNDEEIVETILAAAAALKDVYADHARNAGRLSVSVTLVTKILLGMFGCVPACDRYFFEGIEGCLTFEELDGDFLQSVLDFSREYRSALLQGRAHVTGSVVEYPMMKLVDMYFWQVGYDRELAKKKDRQGSNS